MSTMKTILSLLMVLFLFSACNENAMAVKSKQPLPTEKQLLNDPLAKGDTFAVNREQYQLLPELYSMSQKQVKQQPVSDQLLQTKGNLNIYKSNRQRFRMSVQRDGDAKQFPVVLNKRTGNLGIVVGQIKVIPAKATDVEQLANQFDLTVERHYAHLNTAYLSVEPGQDILEITNRLKSDSRVKQASIEVIEHFRTPN